MTVGIGLNGVEKSFENNMLQQRHEHFILELSKLSSRKFFHLNGILNTVFETICWTIIKIR